VASFDIGIVINNVATFEMDILPDMDTKKLMEIITVNTTAATLVTQKFIPILRARG